MSEEPTDAAVGSVAEEAAKLMHALQDWADQSGAEYAGATASAAAGAARRLHDVNEHLATGGPDCTYCPLCRLIGAVRDTSPEVKHHLASAATSLMHAVASVMATEVPDRSTGRPGPSAPRTHTEKIDVDDEQDDKQDDEQDHEQEDD